MRTVCDWRDLPAVPRRAVDNAPLPLDEPCHRNCSPAKPRNKPRRKRTRFSDLCDTQKNLAETDILVPRKRPRTSEDEEKAEKLPCEEDVQKQTSSQPSSQSEHHASKSPTHSFGRASKPCFSPPVSDSNTTCDETDGDPSDGEAIRLVSRRKRSEVKASPLGNGVSTNTGLAASSSFEHDVASPIKQSKTPRDTDNDSSDEAAVLRVIRRQRSHYETTGDRKRMVQNSNSTPNAAFENLLSSPVSISSATPCNEAEDSSDEEVIRRVPHRRRKPVKASHSASCVSQSASPISNASPKDFVSNPVSCSGKTFEEADDSSDEETVLRGTRRRRRCKRTFSSENDEEQTRSINPTAEREYRICSSSDYESHSVTSRKSRKRRTVSSPSDDQHVKRRRTSTPAESDMKKQRKCRESSELKYASSSVEPLSQDSTRDAKSDMAPRKTCKYKAQRRRCPRQPTRQSVKVPWYMLDEERIPYRLRSSSRNCAARCIYWTKTERRLFKVAKSPIHNRGLYALEDIPAFAPVIEYAGEVVTQVRSEIREWEYQSRHIDEVYMYQLQKGTTDVIDGTKRGGPAKFVNHSCEPNVVADEIQAGGTNRVWFFSLRPIRKNEEILLDYCLRYEPGDIKKPCMCGVRKCKKYLNYYGLTE